MTSGHAAGTFTCLITQPHNEELRGHHTVHAIVDRLDEIIPLIQHSRHGGHDDSSAEPQAATAAQM
jgi:hypothetical protein